MTEYVIDVSLRYVIVMPEKHLEDPGVEANIGPMSKAGKLWHIARIRDENDEFHIDGFTLDQCRDIQATYVDTQVEIAEENKSL